jgi:hypothetical protein
MLQQEFNTLAQAIGQQPRSILKIIPQGTLLRLSLKKGQKQRDQGHAQNQRNDQAKADSHRREFIAAFSPRHADMGICLLGVPQRVFSSRAHLRAEFRLS